MQTSFMFAVFDKHLLTDMGKTIVRRYVHDTDVQSVWKGLSIPYEVIFQKCLIEE